MQIRSDSPLVIAHRGFRARYPENTMAAFKAAVDVGAKMVELDIRFSRDHEMVVIHDATLERTTNGKGLVSDHTLAQLKALDAGSWFDPKFTGEGLPTLETIFDGLGADIRINVEVKPDLFEVHGAIAAIEPLLISLIRAKGRLATALVSCFEPRILENLRALDADIKLAFLTNFSMDEGIVDFCRKLRCTSCNPNARIVDIESVARMHAADILVFPFTVNSTAEFQRLCDCGVDGVITDDPDKFIDLQSTQPH